MKGSGIEGLVARAAKGARLEGPTEVDVVLESSRLLVFIEAKYHSDVSCDTSYDSYRDQITRNLDVGTYQAAKSGKRFLFILLTPDRFERARLYWYKMIDFTATPDHLRRALPYRNDGPWKVDFGTLRTSIGWLLWKDVIAIWRAALVQARRAEQPMDLADQIDAVYQDFQRKGLTAALDRPGLVF
jgi:hypothetical protein